MVTPIFNVAPFAPLIVYGWSDEVQGDVLRDGGPLETVVEVTTPLAKRTYSWAMQVYDDELVALWAFLEARRLAGEAFFLKDPRVAFHARTGVVLTLVSGNEYRLPRGESDDERRGYPIDDANVQLYDGGSPVSHSAVDPDAGSITYTAPPGGAKTADYHEYRKVKVIELTEVKGDAVQRTAWTVMLEECDFPAVI